jgi:hypothetical protein
VGTAVALAEANGDGDEADATTGGGLAGALEP